MNMTTFSQDDEVYETTATVNEVTEEWEKYKADETYDDTFVEWLIDSGYQTRIIEVDIDLDMLR